MLRLSRACRCTSTSNSLPCKHATTSTSTITRSRSYSRKTLPNSAPSPHHSSYANGGGGGWFEPLQYNRLGFRDWLSSNPHSTNSISNSSSSSSSSLYNISNNSSSNRTDSLLNDYLTNRGPRTKLNHYQDEYGELLQLANDKKLFFLKAMVLEDLEFKELGNKGRKKLDLDRFEKRTTTTTTKTKVDGKEGEEEEETMVETGTAKDPNIIENESVVIVEKDNDKVKVLEEEAEISKFSQSVSMLQQIANSTPQSASFTVSQLDQTWENFIHSGGGADLEDSLQDYSLTLSFLHYLLSSSPPPTSSDYEPSSEEEDPLLRLALKVFSSLVRVLPEHLIATYPSLSPSPPQPSTTTTTTMKKMKNGNDSIKFFLLETLVNSALDQDLFEISSKALLSLEKQLRLNSHSHVVEVKEDQGFQLFEKLDEKVVKTIIGSLKILKEERIKSFKPQELKSTRTDLETLSDLISLMNRESRSRRRRKMKEGGVIIFNEVEKDLLNKFVQECGERYRWDLIAKLFKERNDNKGQGQGGGGRGGEEVYELEKYHLKFARWLSGEAPYSTYQHHHHHHHQNYYSISNSMIDNDVKRGKVQIERQSQPELFSLFARITHSQLKRNDSEWNLTEKNEWIDLLTNSTGSTKETRSLARRIVSFWIQQSPLSSSPTSSPFVLRASTLLNLIRSSTKNQSPLSEERLNFLRSLINHSIQSLISPISPYSNSHEEGGGTRKVLSHFDLTSLAQCYDLIGDHESVQQVYRKFLELKFLPDQKDVEIVLAGGGLELVKQAKKVGIKIQEGVMRNLLKGILENQVDNSRRCRGEKEKGNNKKKKKERTFINNQEWKFKVEEVLKFSKEELKFGKEEIERLENLVIGFIPLCQPDQLMKLSDSRLLTILERKKGGNEISIKIGLGLMKKCFETNHFKLVTRLYKLILQHSTTHLVPEVLTYPLETLLKSYSSSSSSSFIKTQILESLKSIIDQTLSSPHLSSVLFFNVNVNGEKKNKNFESIMKGLIKIGQIEAIENFWQTLSSSEQGGSSIDITTNFQVDRSIKELVVRWVVGKEGSREKVLNREGGIIEEWAKEVLSQRT